MVLKQISTAVTNSASVVTPKIGGSVGGAGIGVANKVMKKLV